MEELAKGKKLGVAALRAGVHHNTASKYRREGKLPSERREPRD